MEKLLFRTEEFEGPLDLLLYLIQKHKLDIFDIQISQLLEQYMDYIHELQRQDLEVASDFLEMASRLVYIKTVMLLPRHKEEGEQLKSQLQGELLEYQVCRSVAKMLGERSQMQLRFVRAPMELEVDNTYRRKHPAGELYDAYQDAIGRGRRRLPPPVQAFSGIVSRRVVSVNSRIIHLMKMLYRSRKDVRYDSLFETSADRSELVATFLAVLELVKARRITINHGRVHFCRTRQESQAGEEQS